MNNQNRGKSPIFIGGAGRSGTTLVRVILDSHPNISCGTEFKIIPNIADLWIKTVQHFSHVLTSYNLSVSEMNRSFADFIESLLQPSLIQSGKQRIAEKTPNNVFYFHVLNQLFPESPLIQVIRDGRDVVCSLLTMNWVDVSGKKLACTENARNAAAYWVQAVKYGREAAKSERLRDRYLEIKYEDIVLHPEDTLRMLFKFIDEPWDPAVLSFHKQNHDLGKESSALQVSQRLYSKSIGRWRQNLTGEDKEQVRQIAGDLLIDLGYVESKEW